MIQSNHSIKERYNEFHWLIDNKLVRVFCIIKMSNVTFDLEVHLNY